ncbi:MAG: FHA domain-containing protein [Leptolyngbya sp. BL-A-14]
MQKRHLLLVEDDKERREFVLDSPVYSIGRNPKCDISLVSIFVSSRHATLVQLIDDSGSIYYRIVDGNLKGKASANGLLVNGRRLQSHDLVDGDEIVFGPQVRAIYHLQAQRPPNDGFPTTPLPYKPHPFTPNVSAEALPDDGFSQLL